MRTQRGIDRLTSVISATEQSKHNKLKFIYPPGTYPFKAPSDVAEMDEALQESLENDNVLSFTIPKSTSRRNAKTSATTRATPSSDKRHYKLRMLIWPRSKHYPRNRFSLRHARASSSNSKNGQTWAWRTWNAKELTRKQRYIMHWKSIGK